MALTVWRHPRPEGVQGRCIGARSDPPVHWRRAKRLARRIQAHARRHRLPHRILTSPRSRCADVGRWLRRWGWRHEVDERLLELDFGAWEGRRWADISPAELQAWTDDFTGYAPGGGESLAQLLQRCNAWPVQDALAVSHGGWMLARRWVSASPQRAPEAHEWPAAPGYGQAWTLPTR